jgi:competence protein ComEC
MAVAGAAAAWIGALLGLTFGLAASIPLAVSVLPIRRRRRAAALLLVIAGAGVLAGASAAARVETTLTAAVPEGPISLIANVAEDGSSGRSGVVRPESVTSGGASVRWSGPPLGVDLAGDQRLVAGERVRIEGFLHDVAGRVRGDPIAGRLVASNVERIDGPGPLFAVGNAARTRVASFTGGDDAGRALLRGFLIGDTSSLTARDLDALRRSGLTHFVAVSGSNVALFLAGWWVITAPFGLGSKRRFVLGLIGLAVFVVITRWEASVLRAATMVGLILGGAAAGVVVDGWMALGTAVTLLILGSGQLAVDVGFQLSVAATAGILLGARLAGRRRPRWAWAVLSATAAAQLAVLPILLWHFGSVPLLAPVANLLAAPLVGASTIAGALGVVTGWDPLVAVGADLAALVLGVSRLASSWPQLGIDAVLLIGAGAGLGVVRRFRPSLTVLAALALALTILGPGTAPRGEQAIVLDIGQGDAVLVRSHGMVALIDGGRDPLVLADRLRSHGIGRIDLLVATHGDADHVGGLDGLFADHGVGRFWVPKYGNYGNGLNELIGEASALGISVDRIGARSPPFRIGAVTLRPLGPLRRYAGDNDGSVVLWVEAGRSLLLAGDVEAIAQRELPPVRPDVLLVPHHGSATTDLEWLEETLGERAVVSVGENSYGHPAPAVMAVLVESGAAVSVTAEVGDVVIPLD